MPTSIVGKLPSTRSLGQEGGFTYVMALVAIVLVGIFAGMANLATSRIVQEDREQELLFRGLAYRAAVQQYYATNGRYPRALTELLKDPRFAHRVYLRELYADPMGSQEENKRENGGWRLVRAADGGIAGVASNSKLEPLKKAYFPPGLENFEQAKSYSEWIFDSKPRVAASVAGSPGRQPALGVPR